MKLTYIELLNETMAFYLSGDYAGAYEFITKHWKEVNGNTAQMYNFRYAIASKMGKKELALKLMEEAIIDNGFWYAFEYLNSDEDLDLLRGNQQFNGYLEICKKREKDAHKLSKDKLEFIETNNTDDTKKYQLIMALHGNQESNRIVKNYWGQLSKSNCRIALLQSAAIEFSDAFVWSNVVAGQKAVDNAFDIIEDKYKIHEKDMILSGFSAGGRQVLYDTLFTEREVKGLILIAPWLPELDDWQDQLYVLKEKGTKLYLICGENDDEVYEDNRKLNKALIDLRIAHEFLVIDDLSHDYPKNFSSVIEGAIDYINN